MNYDYLYRIVIFGDSGVGKSSFMDKYIHNSELKTQMPTIGVDFGTKHIIGPNDKKIKIHLWDTSGQANFRNIARSYYSNVAGAILVFDKTNPDTFHNLPNWISDFDSINRNLDIPIIVIGTKTDLPTTISDKEIARFVNQYNVLYAEVNLGVKEDISYVMQPLLDKIWEQFIVTNKMCPGIKFCTHGTLPLEENTEQTNTTSTDPYSAPRSFLTKKNIINNLCTIS